MRAGGTGAPQGFRINVDYVEASEASGHPRLLFGADDVTTLQMWAANTHEDIWAPIRGYADSQVGQLPPLSAPATGDLDTYRNTGNQLVPYAFTCLVSDDENYCELAKAYLLTYAQWEQWGENEYRDLGHAHMLLANALAYDWLYSRLTAEEKRLVRKSLAIWTQRMYEASSGPREEAWGNWWRYSYGQNHNWTAHSALGVAGLALLGEDDRAQMWVDHARDRLARVADLLNGIEDGSWHEGIPYQNYGLTMSLPFWVNLREVQGQDIVPYLYLHNYVYWRLYNHLSGSDDILSYGDFEWSWGNTYGAQNILRFVAAQFENGHAEWVARKLVDANGRSANVWRAPWYVFEFFYYDADVVPQAPTNLPLARVFPDLEGVIWRTGWYEDDLVFALKTGAYGGRFAFDTFTQEVYPWSAPCIDTECQLNSGHDHDDANGFYIHYAGAWLAPESVGVGRNGTEYHNTLLIDGQGQYRPPIDRYGRYPEDYRGSDGYLEGAFSTSSFDYVAADATRRYKQIDGIQDFTRHVVFVRPDYFLMVDHIKAEAVHDYDWVSHFGVNVSVEGRWVRGVAIGDRILGVHIAAPQSFEIITGDDGQPYIRIRPDAAVDDVRFVNLLYPTTEAAWHTRPDVEVMADTEDLTAIEVVAKDGSGRIDNIMLAHRQPISVSKVSSYEYDGRLAIVSRKADSQLERVLVYGATYLADEDVGGDLVTNLDSRSAFEAIYEEQTVEVSCNSCRGVTLYAPEASHLILNGLDWPYTRLGDYVTFSATPGFLPLVGKEAGSGTE